MIDNAHTDINKFSDSNIHLDGERGNSVVIGPSVQPRRLKLSKIVKDRMIGNLPCGVGGKVLIQNPDNYDCVITIYDDWLINSCFGSKPAPINQSLYIKPKKGKKVPKKSKQKFSGGTVTRSMDILKASKLISLYDESYQVGNKSKLYEAGSLTEEIIKDGLDDELMKQLMDERNRARYESYGINYDKPSRCHVCTLMKHVRNFSLKEETVSMSICCGNCYKHNMEGCRKAWSIYHTEQNRILRESMMDTRTSRETVSKPMFTGASRGVLGSVIGQ